MKQFYLRKWLKEILMSWVSNYICCCVQILANTRQSTTFNLLAISSILIDWSLPVIVAICRFEGWGKTAQIASATDEMHVVVIVKKIMQNLVFDTYLM